VAILIQFAFRLSFGLAAAMCCTSPRQVTAGFFRVHLYVVLGLNVLAALAISTGQREPALWLPIATAVVAYAGSVCWLYESRRLGQAALLAAALLSLAAAWYAGTQNEQLTTEQLWLAACDVPTSGLLLGATLTAMFLGHWYLNTPTMDLAPLRRLIALIGLAVALRAGVSLAAWRMHPPETDFDFWLLTLRWLAGLAFLAVLVVMVWRTLKIPNTQSATGILYVAVIVAMIGEACSLVLSSPTAYSL